MRSFTTLTALLLVIFPANAQDKGRLADALALQDAMEAAIASGEQSIACILVSRSDQYGRWNAAPSKDNPGKLGRFDSDRLLHPNQRFGLAPADRDLILQHALSDPDHTPESYGSGIVVDESGLILTCAHVVRNATKVYVRLPGGKGSYADIHAADPRSDLAVLKLLDPIPDLKTVKWGDGGKLRKGQFVVQLAHPYAAGFRDGGATASWGMIANLRRRTPGPRLELDQSRTTTLHHYGTLVQLDTRITLGCSGGAVLNLQGELVGLTTALAGVLGIDTPGGFAVPFNAGVKRIVEVLKRGEEVEYGYLGVQLGADGSGQRGVQIAGTAAGSPAERAGLLPGDVLLSIDGASVRENDDLFLLIGGSLAGRTVDVVVDSGRGLGPRQLKIKLGKFYVPGTVIAANRPPARFGLRVDDISIIGQQRFRMMRRPPDGVVIREVVPDSAADKAQLQPDKIITRVNDQPVASPAEYYRAIARAGRSVELSVINTDGREERLTLEGQ
jgi:serine protease Do